MRAPRVIAITGASRGLGAALALQYAAPGRVLGLAAHVRAEPLEEVAGRCRARGATVETACFDAVQPGEAEAWIGRLGGHGPLDLLIANAGCFGGRARGEPVETLTTARAQIRTNLEAVIALVDAAVRPMIGRGSGHVALVSSLAALHPLADAPAYSASKAGLAAYGESLREALAPLGITISIVYPGHIATEQTEIQNGHLPLLMSAERAAGAIKRGLDDGRTTIAFPKRLVGLIRLGRLLPWRARARASRSQRFDVTLPSRLVGKE